MKDPPPLLNSIKSINNAIQEELGDNGETTSTEMLRDVWRYTTLMMTTIAHPAPEQTDVLMNIKTHRVGERTNK